MLGKSCFAGVFRKRVQWINQRCIVMQIKVAGQAGFCRGVKRAMDIARKVVQKERHGPIYTYGPLVHNPHVIKKLEEEGILPIESIDEVSSGTIIIRSHGISPDEMDRLKKSDLNIVDATCPRVKALHSVIEKNICEGYNIVIAGNREHPEVIALMGFCRGRGQVISDSNEMERLSLSGKICLVAQTTHSEMEFEKISEIMRRKHPESRIINTICNFSCKRQEEVNNIAHSVEAMIVVGGKNSENTRNLARIAGSAGIPVFHLESEEGIDPTEVLKYRSIGVCAGASTPDWMVDKVKERLISLNQAN